MKFKRISTFLIAVAVLAMGLWGYAPSKHDYRFAKKKGDKLEKMERSKPDKEPKRIRTKFAMKSFDSIMANQMLLLNQKERVAIE